MKKLPYSLIFSMICGLGAAAEGKTVLRCTLEDETKVSLEALQYPELDGFRFFLTIDGHRETAFTDMPEAPFVGRLVLSKCLHHVLIFAINYGTPYNKGVVLRRKSADSTIQRIDFSEKALPELLYLGENETQLLVPNHGYEVSSKYLLYRFRVGEGQPEEASAENRPPPKKGFEIVRIKPLVK